MKLIKEISSQYKQVIIKMSIFIFIIMGFSVYFYAKNLTGMTITELNEEFNEESVLIDKKFVGQMSSKRLSNIDLYKIFKRYEEVQRVRVKELRDMRETFSKMNFNLMSALVLSTTIFFLFIIYEIIRIRKKRKKERDVLTEVYNINFLETIGKKLQEDRYSLILIDIDFFDKINKNYGYDSGNEILKKASEKIRSIIGDEDYPIRYNGKSFMVFIKKNGNMHRAEQVADAIFKAISNQEIYIKKLGVEIRITLSIAIKERHETKVDNFLIAAQSALNKAKTTGKNQVHIYDEEKEIVPNAYDFHDIQKYVLNNQLFFMYQPIIIEDRYNKQKIIFESLARLKNEKGEVLSPYLFISHIEGTSLNFEFTKKVINNVLETAVEKQGYYFSLNIDNDLLFNYKIMNLFERFRKEHPEVCQYIVVELLESESIDSYEDMGHIIDDLKNWGFMVAIDDFGSGYSNYSHALELNVDFIKIDGEIVKQIETKVSSLAIIETLFDLSRKIKIPLIAEYIENELIMRKIQEIGIENLQGYHISKPLPINEISEFREKWEKKMFEIQKEEIVDLDSF